jgi:hypothetical protein
VQHFGHFLAVALLDSLDLLFALGAIGCFFVLVMTFWEDLRTIAGH